MVFSSEIQALSCRQAYCFLDKMVSPAARGRGVLRSSRLGEMPVNMAGRVKRVNLWSFTLWCHRRQMDTVSIFAGNFSCGCGSAPPKKSLCYFFGPLGLTGTPAAHSLNPRSSTSPSSASPTCSHQTKADITSPVSHFTSCPCSCATICTTGHTGVTGPAGDNRHVRTPEPWHVALWDLGRPEWRSPVALETAGGPALGEDTLWSAEQRAAGTCHCQSMISLWWWCGCSSLRRGTEPHSHHIPCFLWSMWEHVSLGEWNMTDCERWGEEVGLTEYICFMSQVDQVLFC